MRSDAVWFIAVPFFALFSQTRTRYSTSTRHKIHKCLHPMRNISIDCCRREGERDHATTYEKGNRKWIINFIGNTKCFYYHIAIVKQQCSRHTHTHSEQELSTSNFFLLQCLFSSLLTYSFSTSFGPWSSTLSHNFHRVPNWNGESALQIIQTSLFFSLYVILALHYSSK